MKELRPASGGPWGGTQVDKELVSLLAQIFGTHFMNKYMQKNPQEWLKLATEFDRTKRSFKSDDKAKIVVSIPYQLDKFFYKENKGKPIEQAIKERKEELGVGFSNGSLIIKQVAAMKLFRPVIQSIIQHLSGMLKGKEALALDYLLMVGGFSECEVLQNAIRREFGDNGMKILVPSGAQLTILKGAVLYGHNPGQISKRIARYSYGEAVAVPFQEGIHDEAKKFVAGDGGVYCANIFKTYVTQGEEVKVGETRTFYANTPPDDDETSTSDIYVMDGKPSKPVQYTTDPRVRELGRVTVKTPLEAKKRNRTIETKIEFGETEIKVEVLFVATGAKGETTIDFLHD